MDKIEAQHLAGIIRSAKKEMGLEKFLEYVKKMWGAGVLQPHHKKETAKEITANERAGRKAE